MIKTIAEFTGMQNTVSQDYKDINYTQLKRMLFEQKNFCDRRKIERYDFYQSSVAGYCRLFPQPLKKPAKIERGALPSMSRFDAIHVSCTEVGFYRKIDQHKT
jgi:hypothetical protein